MTRQNLVLTDFEITVVNSGVFCRCWFVVALTGETWPCQALSGAPAAGRSDVDETGDHRSVLIKEKENISGYTLSAGVIKGQDGLYDTNKGDNEMGFSTSTCTEFEFLLLKFPVPGGGGASALVGAGNCTWKHGRKPYSLVRRNMLTREENSGLERQMRPASKDLVRSVYQLFWAAFSIWNAKETEEESWKSKSKLSLKMPASVLRNHGNAVRHDPIGWILLQRPKLANSDAGVNALQSHSCKPERLYQHKVHGRQRYAEELNAKAGCNAWNNVLADETFDSVLQDWNKDKRKRTGRAKSQVLFVALKMLYYHETGMSMTDLS